MLNMKIAADNAALAELQYHLAKLRQGSMPQTAAAMKEGANMIQSRWIAFANGGPLEGIAEKLKRPSGAYGRSIRNIQTGTFDHEIYSEAKIAEMIENGTKEHDMKTTHPFGPRSRMSKEGFPYLIIPFRWGTPDAVGFKNIMTKSIYDRVSKYKKMKTLVDADKSDNRTPNYHGQMVGRAKYNDRYDRLEGMDGSEANMNGMVRSTDDTGKDRSGGYFTFRVISAKQLITRPYSWIKPAMPARHVTKALVKETEKPINEMVEAAIIGDLR